MTTTDVFATTFDAGVENVRRTAQRLEGTGEFPHVTDGGRWRTWRADVLGGWQGDAWDHGNWTCGFWVGLLWMAHRRTGGDVFRDWAYAASELLEPRQDDENTHDIGFVFYPSFALGSELTGDERLRAPALQAARTLARRRIPAGGYLQSWGPLGHPLARRSTAIDTMMNLPLLWWASRVTGDPSFAEIAREHAATSARHYLREDGSTFHTFTFDPDSGAPLGGGTFQGAGVDSAWSRGIAWGIAGWSLAYREHGDPQFLDAAERALRCYREHLPADGVPPWDFADARPDAPRDSSATAIVAVALLELAKVHPDGARTEQLRAQAAALLAALCETCACRPGDEDEGILRHSAYSVPHDDGVDSAVMWGDWFFMRGLAELADGPIASVP
ncbi:MAG: glycoside hydrolase family 88 protein [Conexibacter sp.]